MSASRPDPVVRLVPMTGDAFDAWSVAAVTVFARQLVGSGSMPVDEATAYAAEQHAHLLADGVATPHHHFWTAVSGDDPVGHLWHSVRPREDHVESFVYDVEIAEAARGRGLGGAVMRAGEAVSHELGATLMRLSVFGHNRAAIRLYDRLGYVVELAALRLSLDPALPATGSEDGRVEVELTEAAGQPGVVPPARLLLEARVDGRPAGAFSVQVTGAARVEGFARRLAQPDADLDPNAARAVLRGLADACRSRGLRGLGIEVPGTDTVTRQACVEEGFELQAQLMTRPLGDPVREAWAPRIGGSPALG